MIIRAAQPADAEALARIHIQSWRETYPGIISSQFLENLSLEGRLKAWTDYLSPSYSGPRFNVVADEDGSGLLGFASGGSQRDWGSDAPRLRGYQGELWAIYLLKSHQGRGIGRQLFEAIRSRLMGQGYRSMLVWVLKDNPARKFYERLGAREIASKKIMIDREHEEIAYGWEKL